MLVHVGGLREVLVHDDAIRHTQKAREDPPMGRLFETIRRLVAEEKYAVGEHAVQRLDEREIGRAHV
jgi:hypothetical protein